MTLKNTVASQFCLKGFVSQKVICSRERGEPFSNGRNCKDKAFKLAMWKGLCKVKWLKMRESKLLFFMQLYLQPIIFGEILIKLKNLYTLVCLI